MTSSVETGDAFRDEVVGLLRVAGFDVVIPEILMGHKKVDIRFEETALGKRRRYALEAKRYAQPLDKDDLVRIVADYEPLLRREEVDELFIVSPHPIRSAAANAYLKDNRRITHRSFLEFQEDVMGVFGYLQHLIRLHEEEGFEEYYVPPLLSDGTQLEDMANAWLQSGTTEPVAVLAGYGMGKTTFARHLAYRLARSVLSGNASRIPIFLSLGTVSREQSLEGLIASALAGKANLVKRYNFEAFAALNKLGRFVCLLDGFDEMKHMMSASEFRFNFTELNRLVDGKSKVILLGRPTAFLSDDEKQFVLRGRRPVGDQWTKIPGAPEYREIHLAPFTASQRDDFILRYLSHWTRRETAKTGKEYAAEFVTKRRTEIKSATYGDLISRPVHAKMLAEIATDPHVDLSKISRYTLYDDFIRVLIERESAKEGRRHSFSSDERRNFATNLAWELWTTPTGKTLGCRIEDLPESLFANFKGDDSHDLLAVKRDLVSGSFLEEKAAGVFYIPHRSFQEFLVAEYIANLQMNSEFLLEYHRQFNSDVVSFLIERDRSRTIFNILLILHNLQGQLSAEFLHSFENCEEVGRWIADTAHPISAWHILLAFFGNPGLANSNVNTAIGQLVSFAARTKTLSGVLAILLCLALRLDAAQLPTDQEALCRVIMRLIANRLPMDRFKWEGRPAQMILTTGDQGGFLAEIFGAAVKRGTQSADQALSLELDVSELYRKVRQFLLPRYALEEVTESGELLGNFPEKAVKINFNRAFEITATTKSAAKARIDKLREYFLVQPKIIIKQDRPTLRST